MYMTSLGRSPCGVVAGLLATLLLLAPSVSGKWVEGTISTKENWAFLSRFCFLSLEGQFEYLIEYDKELGTPNLLLYYDDDSQWPAVYHSSKSCKEREAVLNRAGQNQVIRLSHWYPDTEYSGCILTRHNKELPAQKSTTPQPVTKTPKPKTNSTTVPPHPSFYDQFLKTTKPTTPTSTNTNSTTDPNSTTWYELLPTDEWNSTTMLPEDELWESIGPGHNGSKLENLKDVEILFDEKQHGGRKIKRSTSERELIQRYRRRRLNSESNQNGPSHNSESSERLVVSCHNSRRFRSARERWWFIAISNCDSNKGLDIKFKFLMTNGPDGDFWHQHFSADEFYVLPILLAYTLAYVVVLIAVVVCSVELKSRHLLHSTYKLFLVSATVQHAGVLLQSLGYIRYAADGYGGQAAKVTGQFLCGMAEMSFLLLLVLLGKGYTVTRGRLKLGFTVRLTVFACAYLATYVVLFVYQAKAFDPGEVLYLYESPPGYGLIVLRVAAWTVFAYSTFFTVRKYPEKNMFYAPFFICGTLWFYAGPLFILTANSYIDKWVRESVVTAVLLFITFSGHIMFLLLTLPVFANKNFPYHVRTTQIGVMEVTNNSSLDGFGPTAYHPTAGAAQTVIIPLTRRTEELIGNMYREYMASAPPAPLSPPAASNGLSPPLHAVSPRSRLLQQDSTDTNHSDDIRPTLPDKEIFTVESQISKIEANKNKPVMPVTENLTPKRLSRKLPVEKNILPSGRKDDDVENEGRNDLPNVLRSRRNLLEPLKRDVPVPTWSLAKGPCVVSMMRKAKDGSGDPLSVPPHKKAAGVRSALPPSGDMCTIVEGREQVYGAGTLPPHTANLFTAAALRNGGNT